MKAGDKVRIWGLRAPSLDLMRLTPQPRWYPKEDVRRQ